MRKCRPLLQLVFAKVAQRQMKTDSLIKSGTQTAHQTGREVITKPDRIQKRKATNASLRIPFRIVDKFGPMVILIEFSCFESCLISAVVIYNFAFTPRNAILAGNVLECFLNVGDKFITFRNQPIGNLVFKWSGHLVDSD